ncbi:helix-turn-helix domain-containing protein [Actinomadura madurae]|uniref:helix-turn-helix domain-containing protein n=1 Tax=Actinomadura madurae TaxID=1993 RepID=UPI0035579462
MVRSLQRGLQLMNAVGEQGPVHAKQLARHTGVPLATVYHLLRTLLHDRYVVRPETARTCSAQRSTPPTVAAPGTRSPPWMRNDARSDPGDRDPRDGR